MSTENIITQYFLPISLGFIMLSVGLELTVGDFKRVLKQPKGFITGALSQVLLLPAVAFVLVSLSGLSSALAVGVMIIAACPGGVTSNLLTYLARADTALSVSLTAIISLFSVLTLPIIVGGSIIHFMDAGEAPSVSIGRSVIGIFLITALPVAVGITINRFAPAFAAAFEKRARHVATFLFIIIIAGAIYSERANVADYLAQAGMVTLCLNVAMIAISTALARIAGLDRRQGTAITMECGLQNGTLAIFVALTLLGNREMMIPGAIYSLIMFPTALAYLFFPARRSVVE